MEPCRRMLAMMFLVLLVAFGGSKVAIVRADGVCNMTTDGLNACKPAVSGPAPTNPSPECCTALVNADLPCLCSYRNSFLLLSFGIDPDRAMELPAKCNLTAPAQC